MVQGRPNLQRRMSLWYEKYRMPIGATRRYQYSIFDEIQTSRQTTSPEEAAILSRGMPRLDLLIIAPDEIHLVELKPNAQLKDVGQVFQYQKFLQRDIFMKQHLSRPQRLVLCSLVENAGVRAACQAENIEYIVIPVSELPELP